MYLQEIFNDLTAGEFSQLNFNAAGAGVIDDSNTNIIVSHINRGLTDLHTRFELQMRKVSVVLQPGQTSYKLTSKHALNGRGAIDPKYILDTATNKFGDDVLLISKVVLDTDFQLPMNRTDLWYSCLTPAMDMVDIPQKIVDKDSTLPLEMFTDNVTVHYQANHVLLNPDVGSFNPDRLVINLPQSHLTALLYFVASRASNPVGMSQEFNAGNTYAAKYEAECARLKNDGMEIQQREPESKFCARGFV